MEACFLVLEPHFCCQIVQCKLHQILAMHVRFIRSSLRCSALAPSSPLTFSTKAKLPTATRLRRRAAFFPLRLPARLGGSERNGRYDPQRDTDRRACGEVHKDAVTRDHVLLASSGQRDGLIHQNLWRELEDSTKFAEMQ
jgi:hypothetical protein